MSHTYHLVCIDCGTVLDLGKIACLNEEGESIPWQVAGWQDQENREWVSDQKLWKLVERFFILHRGHELNVVSEAFLDRIDPEGKLIYIDSAIELMSKEVDPEPDDYEDADNISPDISGRLRKKV